jgi:dTDP-4-amino-4,6-dideoxygalactose transaminase
MINFGIDGPDSISEVGINAKMSEFHAAMGLCVLDEIDEIMEKRAEIWNLYTDELKDSVKLQACNQNSSNNYSYFPVLFKSEKELLQIEDLLNEKKIHPRRYFYPSLDMLNYVNANQNNYYSHNTASRILCLPIYPDIDYKHIESIVYYIKNIL